MPRETAGPWHLARVPCVLYGAMERTLFVGPWEFCSRPSVGLTAAPLWANTSTSRSPRCAHQRDSANLLRCVFYDDAWKGLECFSLQPPLSPPPNGEAKIQEK